MHQIVREKCSPCHIYMSPHMLCTCALLFEEINEGSKSNGVGIEEAEVKRLEHVILDTKATICSNQILMPIGSARLHRSQLGWPIILKRLQCPLQEGCQLLNVCLCTQAISLLELLIGVGAPLPMHEKLGVSGS